MYISQKEIWRTQPKLQQAKNPIEYSDVLDEAVRTVRAEVDYILDLDWIDEKIRTTKMVPSALWGLSLSKARELAYRIYYDGREPEDSEVVLYSKEYYKRLKSLKDDIANGVVDSRLKNAVDNTKKGSVFI